MKNVFFTTSLFAFLVYFSSCSTPRDAVKPIVENKLATLIDEYEAFNNEGEDRIWNTFTKEEQNSELSKLIQFENSLSKINDTGLSEMDIINRDVLKYIISNDISNIQHESHLRPLNSEGGFITGLFFGTANANLASEESKKKYKAKLEAIPDYVDWQISNLKEGAEKGKTLPKVIIDRVLSLMEPHLSAAPSESVFANALKTTDDENFKSDIYKTIKNSPLAALDKLHNYLKTDYYQHARDEVGISGIPDGKAYYVQRVKYFTSLDISPEEVFNIGMKEVARIKKDMEGVIDELNFEGSFEEFFTFLRTDPQFYAKTPEELLGKASWLSKKIENEMPKYFGRLPRMPFSVKPVPASIAPNYTGGRYSGGSYKNNRAGQYWVNTYRLETRPLYVLPSLTLHEAVPGHHHQIMLSQEIENVPNFRRRNYLSAFGEGWGLYSEFLGTEIGMYETPYEDFGRMTYEMWRACRLVVDVGMHYKGWTREQAVEFMASNTALSLHEVNTEIDRYIGWPAQAVSYKMGELKIRELRRKAEGELGPNFNIRDFHDRVLENGSVLMSTLEGIVDKYIAANKKA